MSGESETEIAARLKAEMRGLLEQVCLVQDKARAAGMILNYNTAPGPVRYEVVAIQVVKPL